MFSVQTLTVAAPEGLDQFYSVKECLILAGLDIKQVRSRDLEIIFEPVFVLSGAEQLYSSALAGRSLHGEGRK